MANIKFILLLLGTLTETAQGILFLTKWKFKKFKLDSKTKLVEKEQRQVLTEIQKNESHKSGRKKNYIYINKKYK